VLFSSESGDAWTLEPSEYLAVRLASDGHPEPIHIEDTETTFTVAWTGQYRVMGPALLYTDRHGRRVVTMFGYPTRKLAQIGATGAGWGGSALQFLNRARAKNFKYFWLDVGKASFHGTTLKLDRHFTVSLQGARSKKRRQTGPKLAVRYLDQLARGGIGIAERAVSGEPHLQWIGLTYVPSSVISMSRSLVHCLRSAMSG
jgi:hypothetical protein